MLLPRHNSTRNGGIAVILLIVLPMLLLALLVAVNAGLMVEAEHELQRATDASGLAAAQVLVDDAALLESDSAMMPVLTRAKKEAQDILDFNPVMGGRTKLLLNAKKNKDNDLVFGFLRSPTTGFEPVENETELYRINTLRLRAHRTQERNQPIALLGRPLVPLSSIDLIRTSTVLLDHNIIGFRPVFETKPIPVVPIAILSTPGDTTHIKESWEFQYANGLDLVRRDREKKAFEEGQDGLREIKVVALGPLPKPSEESGDSEEEKAFRTNACLLHIGISNERDLADQIRDGIQKPQLKAFNGELVLDEKNQRIIPGTFWNGSEPRKTALVLAALKELQRSHEARVWPLFTGLDGENDFPIVTNFVAARVVQVTEREDAPGVVVILQPTKMSTATAVSAASRPSKQRTERRNPFICKVRLINQPQQPQ